MDRGCLPWSSKGKGKDGKDKGRKGNKGKGDKNGWYNNGGKGGKGKSKDKGGKGQDKHQGGGNAESSAGYCGKCGTWGHKPAEELPQPSERYRGRTAANGSGTPVRHRGEMETPRLKATEEEVEETEDESLISPIIVDDRQVEETPVAEVSTSDEHYGVEAMLDSGAGASVCIYSPTDFPNVAIDTKTAVTVTKVYRCADGENSECTVTSGSVLRPIIALSCLVQGGWDLSFGGAPVEATATHRTTQRRLGLVQRAGLYFIPLFIAAHRTQHVRSRTCDLQLRRRCCWRWRRET
eukprot:1568550-Amphidinium_carterae.5